ncbi:MAG TPA: DUF2165 domain-containing protein [Opitutaceae bacterium]|jgi:predicted small integral membrane protein|nr:DUF2165 domain-containing protein [Opitutaceae bacterium]
MTLRRAQALLVAASAFYLLLVVFNNVTDYGSNRFFIRHVLAMDTTFPGNTARWRALSGEGWIPATYALIIGWEALCCVLQAIGAVRLWRASSREAWRAARRMATAGLTLSLLQWYVAFLSIGGEWFLMWQSKTWNGQDAALRLFTVMGICLILLHVGEWEESP